MENVYMLWFCGVGCWMLLKMQSFSIPILLKNNHVKIRRIPLFLSQGVSDNFE